MYQKVVLSNGEEIALTAAAGAVERDVASTEEWKSKFSEVLPSISALSSDLAKAMANARPDKATVEFGLKLEFETSKLLAVLCSAGTSADLKIKLEWSKSSSQADEDSAT